MAWTTVSDNSTSWSDIDQDTTTVISTVTGTPLGILLAITHTITTTVTTGPDETDWTDVADQNTSWTTV